MGSFWGHLANGTFFQLYALSWTIYHAYSEASPISRKTTRARHGRSSRCCRPPVIGMALMVLGCIAVIVGENVHPVIKWRIVDQDGNWTHYPAIWQHCTIVTFFGTYATVTLLGHTCVPSAAFLADPLGALAFGVEGMLFVFHNWMQSVSVSSLVTLLHVLLLIPIFACFLAALGESFSRKKHHLVSYTRVLFTLHQGTWMCHMAFILYPSAGNPGWGETKEDKMYAAMFLFWHLLVDFIVLVVLYNITRLIVRVNTCRKVQQNGPVLVGEKVGWRDDIGMELIEETTPCLPD